MPFFEPFRFKSNWKTLAFYVVLAIAICGVIVLEYRRARPEPETRYVIQSGRSGLIIIEKDGTVKHLS